MLTIFRRHLKSCPHRSPRYRRVIASRIRSNGGASRRGFERRLFAEQLRRLLGEKEAALDQIRLHTRIGMRSTTA